MIHDVKFELEYAKRERRSLLILRVLTAVSVLGTLAAVVLS